ncbi:hypothetical protein A2U01_0110357, partial [Trifolium medium]|nr:hypothetical protein [Trifolium medium]
GYACVGEGGGSDVGFELGRFEAVRGEVGCTGELGVWSGVEDGVWVGKVTGGVFGVSV